MQLWRCHFGSISGKHLLQLCLSLFVVYKDLCHAIKDIGEKEATYEEQRRHMSVSSFDNILRRRASGLLICLQVLK